VVAVASRPDLTGLLSTQQARLWLAQRDVTMVFRYLSNQGVSQRQVAQMIGRRQSEVAEVAGGRKVGSYDLLVQICSGLHVQRGWMGLAYDEETAHILLMARILDP